eukprot:611722-Alexandrium_andersonii.AAC.1
MSASLVGSEMCIRDRDESVGILSKGPLEGEEGAAGAAMPAGSSTGSIWSVSYTHLTLPTICSV